MNAASGRRALIVTRVVLDGAVTKSNHVVAQSKQTPRRGPSQDDHRLIVLCIDLPL